MAEKKTQPSSMSAPPSTADAVAVAIKQQDGPEQAPTVIAGGRGRVAEQILEIAFSHGIKVREDADLAQMLSVVDVDSEIPLEAFAIVAEILTYVYEANNAMSPASSSPPPDDAGHPSAARLNPDELAAAWMANKGNRDDGSD